MFTKKADPQEFFTELEANLARQEKFPKQEKQAKIAAALDNIVQAANLLDEAGLEKQADLATRVLAKLAWHVPSSDTSGLTPEKMEKNLAEKGWVFNADDGGAKPQAAPEAKKDDDTQDAGDGQFDLQVSEQDIKPQDIKPQEKPDLVVEEPASEVPADNQIVTNEVEKAKQNQF